MRTIFSTEGLDPRVSFRRWREALVEQFVPIDHRKLHSGPFTGKIEHGEIGSLSISRVSSDGVRTEATPRAARLFADRGTHPVSIMLRGVSSTAQLDRTTVQHPGDIHVLDNRPAVVESGAGSQGLVLEVPRELLERTLGSAHRYANLIIAGSRAETSLARNFIHELVQVHDRLDAHSSARMASIAIDLLVASIATHLAQDTPKPLQHTVLVQRAKAYVEANLGDHTLDPPQLAAAMGVSLRLLQQLFHERGRYVSDWIWERRLAVAAERLRDPACAHLKIGTIAYNCGFISQAHFSRRFRDFYGMTPNETRHQARSEALKS